MISSLIIGFIALILPVNNLIKMDRLKIKKIVVYNVLSFTACSISMFFQIIYNNYLVRLRDWTSIMDTNFVSTLASLVLLVSTIVLNFIVLFIYRSKNLKTEI